VNIDKIPRSARRIHVKDLDAAAHVVAKGNPDAIVVQVKAQKEEVVAAVAPVEGAVEPEVIKKLRRRKRRKSSRRPERQRRFSMPVAGTPALTRFGHGTAIIGLGTPAEVPRHPAQRRVRRGRLSAQSPRRRRSAPVPGAVGRGRRKTLATAAGQPERS